MVWPTLGSRMAKEQNRILVADRFEAGLKLVADLLARASSLLVTSAPSLAGRRLKTELFRRCYSVV